MDAASPKVVKQRKRRFSKTTSFGQAKIPTAQSIITDKMFSLSECCARSFSIKGVSPELQNFSQYFTGADYDAFKIDKALKGNSMIFTLLYIYNKLNWKNALPKVSEEKFRNMTYNLQKAYR